MLNKIKLTQKELDKIFSIIKIPEDHTVAFGDYQMNQLFLLEEKMTSQAKKFNAGIYSIPKNKKVVGTYKKIFTLFYEYGKYGEYTDIDDCDVDDTITVSYAPFLIENGDCYKSINLEVNGLDGLLPSLSGEDEAWFFVNFSGIFEFYGTIIDIIETASGDKIIIEVEFPQFM